MPQKATWCWNGSTADGQTVFGFSETWYSNLTGQALVDSMRTLARTRAPMLAAGCFLFGYRIGQPGGKAITIRENASIKAPRGNDGPNVPQDAALCQARGTAAGLPTKRFWLHCLPDDQVANGKFANPNQMAQDAATWVNELNNAGFMFRYQILGTPARVASISDLGAVVLSDNIVVAAGTDIKLLRVKDVNGRGATGIFRVAATPAPTATTFSLLGWTGQEVGVSGKVAVVTYGFTAMSAAVTQIGAVGSAVIRPGTRKCGRPFGQLVGRASAKRVIRA